MKTMCRTLSVATLLGFGALQAFGVTPSTTAPFNECPAVGADTSCAILVIINPGGSLTVKADATQGPYDGVEDTLIGVFNNSGGAVPSITLSGVGATGVPIFGFEGDGICTFMFTGNGYCASLPNTASGYEGPANTFTNISVDQKTGTVTFTGGLVSGATTYFSLEDQITAATPITPPTTPGVPVPSSVILMFVGLAALAMFYFTSRKFARAN